MKLGREKIDSVVAALEAEAFSTRKNVSVEFYHRPSEWEEMDTGEEGTSFSRDSGFIIYITGQLTRGPSYRDSPPGEVTFSDVYEIKNPDGKVSEECFGWDEYEYYLNRALEYDYNRIKYNSSKGTKTFKAWAPFAKAVGIANLEMLAAKVPKAIRTNFEAMCGRIGESPSEHLRKLVTQDLEEYLKKEAKRLMFFPQEAA